MRNFIQLLLLFFIVSCQSEVSNTASNNSTSTATPTQAISDKMADGKMEAEKMVEKAATKMDEMADKAKMEKEMTTEKPIKDIIEKAVATKPVATAKPSSSSDEKMEKMAEDHMPAKDKMEKVAKTATAAASTKAEKVMTETKKMEKKMEEKPMEKKLSHKDFDAILKKYVSASGVVNYSGLKNDRANLNAYMEALAKETPQSSWSKNEKLAYWINAYNAFTLDLILDNHPLKSITDLDGGSPWKVKRITLAGKKYSLDQIENQIIRPQFKEPRIHFAVNCAAKSCPTLLNAAFLPETLNSQLEKQTKKFVNNAAFNQISGSSAKVSKIFEWYGEDFGDLKSYLNKYSSQKIGDGTQLSLIHISEPTRPY